MDNREQIMNTHNYTNAGATNDDERPVHSTEPITMQPQNLQHDYPGARRPIPVSTVDWRSMDRSQFIPVNGLDFLIGVTSILIQQTVELGDLMSNMEAESRYLIKVPGGETLYLAGELSSPLQRLFCGSRRGCTFSLNDHTRQEALMMKRRLAMTSCCFPCQLQEMTIVAPPGDYLGQVKQEWTISVPLYLVKNASDELIFVIEGPPINTCCGGGLDVEFKILSADSLVEQGSIIHRWEQSLANYVMFVSFPSMAAEPKTKALIIGAAFLLEYTYFARAKSTKCISYCC